jgi:hypothetical protein
MPNIQLYDESTYEESLVESGVYYEDDADGSESSEDAGYVLSADTDIRKFLKAEITVLEPERKRFSFTLRSDGKRTRLTGYPLKDVGDAYIFQLTAPERKMKKITVSDISLNV